MKQAYQSLTAAAEPCCLEIVDEYKQLNAGTAGGPRNIRPALL